MGKYFNGEYKLSSKKINIKDEISGEADLRRLKDLTWGKEEALKKRQEAKVIADVTSQRPSENKSEKNANIYVSLE